jgi:integrase
MSLGTRLFRRAEWLAEKLENRVQSLVHRPAMTLDDIRRILREYLNDLLTSDAEARVTVEPGLPVYASWVPGMPGHEVAEDADVAEARDNTEVWKAARRSRDYASVSEEVEDLVARHGVPEALRPTLALGVIETFIKLNEVAEHRASGEAFTVLDVPPGPELPPPLPVTVRKAEEAPSKVKAPRASSLVEPFFLNRETVNEATHQVMGQERGTLRRFIEVAGDRPVDAYGRGDLSQFLNTLRRLPGNYGKSPKDKDRLLADIIAQADADGAERLSDKTVKRHLSALSQFFKFAMDQGHISNAFRAELVEDHAFKEARRARDQREAWTPDDLKKLFASPVWTGCREFFRSQAGPHIIRDAKFWLPLLALFQGGRLEEFADLRRKDIVRDNDAGGIWAFDLNEEARRLKTENAVRMVPLHPEILRLGFIAYVEKTAPNPDDPLFPDIEPQGADRKRGPRMTRWFVNYRREIGLYREGVAMHAFRHTVNTRLRDVIKDFQQERHVAYLLGHSQGGGEGRERYDKGPGLQAVAETLALLRYPELDLSHLYEAQQ